MGLTSALSNAKSGLFAASRSAEIVANNVANSMTEGYGRREIRLASASLGGVGSGVSVIGVDRVVAQSAINERRLAEAAASNEQGKLQFLETLTTRVGEVDDSNSLLARFSEIETSLNLAIATPENETQLGVVVENSKRLVSNINALADDIVLSREAADAQIAESIDLLNNGLQSISSLNTQIRAVTAVNGNANGLIDERQRIIDSISPLIPIVEVSQPFGEVKILATNGTTLVGSDAAVFGFSRTATITPDMTLASGALSNVSLSGAESSVGNISSIIAGGSIAAQFEVRDSMAVAWNDSLDEIAIELVERFSNPSLDPTLAGAVGLFTDNGGAIVPGDELGAAGRLQLNAAVDPAQGGEVWRLRDGLGAATTGSVGNASLLTGIANTFNGQNPTGTLSLTTSIKSDANRFVSDLYSARTITEDNRTFLEASKLSFIEQELGEAVDTDQELQELLLIEQSYAANARVLSTIDELLQSLIRI